MAGLLSEFVSEYVRQISDGTPPQPEYKYGIVKRMEKRNVVFEDPYKGSEVRVYRDYQQIPVPDGENAQCYLGLPRGKLPKGGMLSGMLDLPDIPTAEDALQDGLKPSKLPLSGEVFEDDAAVGFNDDPTRANSSRVAVAKLQRSVRETRDALHAKKMENEAQQAEIQDLRDHLANSDLAVNVAAAQNKTGARYSNSAEDLAPTAPPDVLRAFVCDDALNEETREAARSVLAAQAASQIEMVAKTTARTSNIAELNDERRFTERYSSAIAAVQSSDNDMATAAAEWVKFRAWLGAERLLRHEAHMGKVLGRDVALADLKLLEQEDIDELSSEMTRVEKARFKAAVQALQAVEELPHASEE